MVGVSRRLTKYAGFAMILCRPDRAEPTGLSEAAQREAGEIERGVAWAWLVGAFLLVS